MTFTEQVKALHREFSRVGYEVLRKPVDTSMLSKEERIAYCEIIARKDYFNIIYLEVTSNWKRISNEVARHSQHPCLVITKYKNSHHILTIVRNHGTRDAKARYLIIDTGSRSRPIVEFIQKIKVRHDADHLAIDATVQQAFDDLREYRQAIEEFGERLAHIIKKTAVMIDKAIVGNDKYNKAAKRMLEMCKQVISDKIELDDIKSMLLQHILTYKIFALVYDDIDFHSTNTVAKSLEGLKHTLDIPYDQIRYPTIELIAESLTETDDQREFLKKVYETFYKAYDPKRAEKDGIVYTPLPAINFMVKSTDELLQKHFSKSLSDEGVTILDPATGTGAFIEHILRQIKPDKIRQKYRDLHANEISILPYYIAALTIEHTYWELTGEYIEFENICWMDTLDSGVKNYETLTAYFTNNDNIKRMSRQQESDIRVTIANPPYNAVQTSLNNANPADKYGHIDRAIQECYYKTSRAGNKNKSFDMYKRFLRWSSDRIRGNGTVVFISNNSFLDAKADAGIRKALYGEFDHIYIVNLKGNARLAGEAWRKEGAKIFGSKARVGICISFFVKTGEKCSDLQYAEVDDYAKLDEKIAWLNSNTISTLDFRTIEPDKNSTWLNQTNNDFDDLLPVLPRDTDESIFHTSTPGVTVAKDDWAYDIDLDNLKRKIKYYISIYGETLQKYSTLEKKPEKLIEWVTKKIKWSQRTIDVLSRQEAVTYSEKNIRPTLYRPFVVKHQYYADPITHRMSQFPQFFQGLKKNKLIVFTAPATNAMFNVIASDLITDFGCVGGTQNIPLYITVDGKQKSNVTKYALQQFRRHYNDKSITYDDIFYYTYAMFNDPKYERMYRHNLRRVFPRIPLAKSFQEWVTMGRELFQLHCNFYKQPQYKLKRIDKLTRSDTSRLTFKNTKKGITITIDDSTVLENIPESVLEWNIKSKTALEWILEFYKEAKNKIRKSSSDSAEIRNKFSTYELKNHKEELITLIQQVTTVCVKTMQIRNNLEKMKWGQQPEFLLTLVSDRGDRKKSESNSTQSTTLQVDTNILD